MITQSPSTFTAVYRSVNSWRYGRSLGIDPIGVTSTVTQIHEATSIPVRYAPDAL
nr:MULTISPECIES: hypothetical protein [unclassified Coleofasciculus]